MRWSYLMVLPAVLLLIVNARGQAPKTSSSVPVIDCTGATYGRPTLKNQTPSHAKNNGEQQGVNDGQRPSFQENSNTSPKSTQVEFFGLTALKVSEALKLLCARKEPSTDRQTDVEAASAASALKEVLISRGYANAEVHPFVEKGAIRFFVNEGMRVPMAALRFESNKVFSSPELLTIANGCLARVGEGANGYHSEKLEYCGRTVVDHIRSAGYLEAKLRNKTTITETGYLVSFALDEGTLYRLGKIKIEGAEAFTENDIREKFGLREGDIANASLISKWLFEDLNKAYLDLGFIEYTADIEPTFKREQGLVDLKIGIDEGKQFSLRSITFVGEFIKSMNLEDLLVLKPGNIYNQRLFRDSIARLNDTGVFEPVDANRDVEFIKDSENGLVQLTINLRKRE